MRWLAVVVVLSFTLGSQAATRPNVLWITSEDNGPHLGCYGDRYATTPHLDALAAKGTIYLNCWSNAPVCAPARTTLISGLYPPATGAEHMRSFTRLPAGFKMFPQYLRAAGYYCSNNRKEDYNLEKPGPVWDASSRDAHWRNRAPDQPFFAVFNFTVTHESRIRQRPHDAVHDPQRVRVPAYHPDTPEVRRDWAQYYDRLTEMDAQVGQVLQQLEDAGLTDDTIVFYFGDHGPGMPRCKRWPYDSGLSVPLIVFIPPQFRALAVGNETVDAESARLVSFVDFAPTVLSLCGVEPPAHFHGKAFLGPHRGGSPEVSFGFRGRMDERYDLVRVARDSRYVYIRNYMPHKVYGQFVSYMFETPTTRVWKALYDRGQLQPPQTVFWERKPSEELYDLSVDPDEVANLAGLPQHAETLQRLRAAQQAWALQIRDVGFLPEGEIHRRAKGRTPYEMGHDEDAYPLERILRTADAASALREEALPELVRALADDDSAVRYWAALGLLMRGEPVVQAHAPALRQRLEDEAAYVRMVAAEALGQYGDDADRATCLQVLVDQANLDNHDVYEAMWAANALDALDERARPAIERIKALPLEAETVPGRMRDGVKRLLAKTLADLEAPVPAP